MLKAGHLCVLPTKLISIFANVGARGPKSLTIETIPERLNERGFRQRSLRDERNKIISY